MILLVVLSVLNTILIVLHILHLILYKDGERRYIIAPKGIAVGSEVMSGAGSPIKPGNCMPLRIFQLVPPFIALN